MCASRTLSILFFGYKTDDFSSKANLRYNELAVFAAICETVGARRAPRRLQDSPYNNSQDGPKQPGSCPEIVAYHSDSCFEAMHGKTSPEKPEMTQDVA